jgi:methionyl-tRNA synthetase
MNTGRFFVTTPIYYINDAPHIGHAYTTIAADILARYFKNRGAEVFFLTGTDEHGQKISQAAAKNGVKVENYANDMALKYQAAWSYLNIKYDSFIRTTDPSHTTFVQKFVQKLYDNGEIYKDQYKGLYCVGCEMYENQKDLLPGNICPIHKTKCEEISEDIYFFKLSKYQNQLMEAIQSKKILIEPEERRNEVFQFLAKEPLKDLAISRSRVDWGIPLPWDKKQTVYVWVDALLNYITGSRGIWPPTVQIMAKDIFRFHAIIWPALLIATGYELPEKIFIHGYFTIDSVKMSKSLGNVVDPIEIAKVYGVDALRYFLFREVPFGRDGDFSLDRFDKRYKADLANDLGNLFQRVIIMAKKYKVEWNYRISPKNSPEINKAIEELRFSDALNLIWQIITEANQQIDMERPWDLAKTNEKQLQSLIVSLLEVLSQIAGLLNPFMPQTTEKMIKQLKTLEAEPLFPRKK